MADWREGKDPKPARKATGWKSDNVGPVESQAPSAAPTPAPTASNAPARSTSDWRGRKGQKSVGASQQTRSEWMRAENAPVAVRGIRRKIFLLLAALAIPLLTIAFYRWVNPSPQKLPLLVAMPESYQATEFLELPFCDKAKDQFTQTNSNNVQLLKDSSGLLDNILASGNWLDKYIDEPLKFRDKRLMGGGPDANIVAFYLSGYLLTDRQGGSPQVRLLASGASPFADDRNKSLDSQALPVSTVLQRILDAVDPSSKVWVTLDLRPAPIIANFADMHVPLTASLQEWHDKLKKEDSHRLIITLPCQDDQENWLAPELGGSVLGHFYRLCLAGEFEERSAIGNNSVTLAEAKTWINNQVSGWTFSRRSANQVPQWIMSSDTEAAADKVDLVFTNGDQRKPKISPSPFEAYVEINDRWDKLARLGPCYRWDPLEYAVAEAQLIHMQDLMEAGATRKSFNVLTADVDAAIERLKNRKYQPPEVSLIEESLVDEYLQPDASLKQLFAKEHAQWLATPPWAKGVVAQAERPADSEKESQPKAGETTGPAAPTKDTDPPARQLAPSKELTDRGQVGRFIVYMLQRRAASNDQILWEATFNQEVLKWCLEFCQTQQPASAARLELQFLKILVNEVNWQTSDPSDNNQETVRQRCKTVALAWHAFCDLQRLASNPRPEVAWWLGDAIHQTDSHLHLAVDYLIAEQYAAAGEELNRLQNAIKRLDEHNSVLVRGIDLRDETLWLTPHLLAWYLHSYRFDDRPQEIEGRLENLGRIVSRAWELSEALRPVFVVDRHAGPTEKERLSINEGKLDEIDRLNRQLSGQLESAKQQLYGEIKDLNDLPNYNPQKIRLARIALRSPLVDVEIRRNLSSRMADFFKKEIDERSGANNGEKREDQQRDLQAAMNRFLEQLPSKSGELYYQLCRSDVRARGLAQSELWITDDMSSKELLRSLYDSSNHLRGLALAFGAYSSYRNIHDQWQNEARWSAPTQYQSLSRMRQIQLQVERLAHGWWGDGDLGAITSESQLYFYAQANKYLAAARADKKPEQIAGLCTSMLESAHEVLSLSAQRWEQLKLSFLDNSQEVGLNEKGHVVKFSLPSDQQLKPSLYLDRQRRPPSASNYDQRTEFLDLAKDQRGHIFRVDQSQIDGKPLVLALRGHYRQHELRVNASKIAKDFGFVFDRRENKPPKLRVTHKIEKPTKVIVVLDCSASMGEVVDDPSIPGAKSRAFEQAQNVTIAILDALADIRESHAIQLGLVLFAKRQGEAKFPDLYAGDAWGYSDMHKADGDFVDELKKIVMAAKPSGDTPLYRAIAQAVNMAETESLIYVVSDGVDDDEKSIGARKLKQLLGDSHQLQIYQFNNESYYRNKGKNFELPKVELEQQRVDMNDLTRGRYVVYKDFAQLKADILNALPRSKVTIYSGDNPIASGKLGDEINIDLTQAKDLPLKVSIDAELNSPGSAHRSQQNLSLIGDEVLTLEFSEQSDRLTFMDIKAADRDNRFQTVLVPPESLRNNQVNIDVGVQMDLDLFKSTTESMLTFNVSLLHKQPAKNYTPRPVLILGRLSEPGQAEDSDYLLADSRFRGPRHYPVIEFPHIPWPREKTHANLTLWMAFEKVNFKDSTVNIKDQERISVERLGAIVERQGNTVTVQLPTAIAAEQRVFVVCNQAAHASRQYNAEKKETHVFTLYDSVTELPESTASVELITVGQVNEALNNNKLMEVRFEKVSLIKR